MVQVRRGNTSVIIHFTWQILFIVSLAIFNFRYFTNTPLFVTQITLGAETILYLAARLMAGRSLGNTQQVLLNRPQSMLAGAESFHQRHWMGFGMELRSGKCCRIIIPIDIMQKSRLRQKF